MTRNNDSSFLGRLFGLVIGFFVAALLLHFAVRLIESVLPALFVITLIAAGVGLMIAVWRSRRNNW